MLKNDILKKIFEPNRVIVYVFLTLISIGTVLLMLPFSHNGSLKLIDAVFLATSGVCVTGLIVFPLSKLTFFGQIVLLLLIQLGGLGYLTLTTFSILTGSVSIKERSILTQYIDRPTYHNLVSFIKTVFKSVFLIEVIGAIILAVAFYSHGLGFLSIWYGIFHSISAFNNAGFSVFDTNLVLFNKDIILLTTIALLIVSGGIGFLVFEDIYMYRLNGYISHHTRVVLRTTLLLITIPAIFFFIMEYNASLKNLDLLRKIANSLFMVITSRTAGFNTIDMGMLEGGTVLIMMLLMFIGASSGGTGGGIKTTTFAVIISAIRSYILGVDDVYILRSRISHDVLKKAFGIFVISIFFVFFSFFLIAVESGFSYRHLFEVVSAFATCGLSLNLTGELSDMQKVIIIFTMLTGRVGVFVAIHFFISRVVKKPRFRYPEVPISVG